MLPVDAELSTPAVYREADRLGLTRTPRRARRSSTRSCASGTWAPDNDLQDAARSLCPRDRRRARRGARRGRRPRARLRLRPDRRRAVRRRGRPGPRGRGGERLRLAARGRGRAGGRGLGGGARLMHPFPLAGAVGLAIFLAVRFRRLGRTTLVLGVLVVAGLALWGFGVVEPPNLTTLIEDVGTRLGKWTYLLVGALAFLETGAFIGLIAPGETAVLIGGVVAGQGEISIVTLIGLVWVCAVAGDLHLLHARPQARARLPRAPRTAAEDHRGAPPDGRGVLRPPRRPDDPDRALHRPRARARAVHRRRVEDGAAARSSPTTSSARACGRRCSACSATSSGSRSTRSRSTSARARRRSRAWWWSASRSVFAVRLRRDPEMRARVQRRLDANPVWRRVRGPLVLRLGPPHAGPPRARADDAAGARGRRLLHVTSGSRRCSAPRSSRGSTTGRSTIADALYTPVADDIVSVLTHVGSLPVTLTAVLLTAGWAIRRAAPRARASRSIAAYAVTFAAVHIGKAATDRPRPVGSARRRPRGWRIPRATAPTPSRWWRARSCSPAAATGWRRASRSSPSRSRSPLGVAASRVYLRVHYLSDVVGGLALGTGIFSLAGIVALVVGALRNNGGR